MLKASVKGNGAARNTGHVGARLKALYILIRIPGLDFVVNQDAMKTNLSHGVHFRFKFGQ